MGSFAMNLRRYKPADAKALVALFTAAVHTLGTAHYDAEQRDAWAPNPPDLDEWRSRFAGLHTLVAEEGDSYLGFLSYETNGHIDLLFTSPYAARKGVASALLEKATTQLSADNQVTELFTEASLVAVPFFTRHGFEVTEKQDVIRRGVSFTRFAMRRRVKRN